MFQKVMKKLNLLDFSGNLSITNAAVYVCLFKLATAPQAGITEVGALMLSLSAYAHKKHLNAKATDANESIDEIKANISKVSEVADKISEVESKVNSLILSKR